MNIIETQITVLPLAKLVNNNGQIAGVPKNPRTITGDKFRALVERLRANNLTGVNPLKVYEQGGKFVVLGGNQRLRALRELKAESVPCIIVPQDTAAEVLREIVILDNTNDGENDWDALANEWEQDELKEWGVDAANWEQPQEEEDGENPNELLISERQKACKSKVIVCSISAFGTETDCIFAQEIDEETANKLLQITQGNENVLSKLLERL